MKENEKIQGQLLDDDALEDVSGGTAKLITTPLRGAAKDATTTVQRMTGSRMVASPAIQQTPMGARDKDQTSQPAKTSKRIVSV